MEEKKEEEVTYKMVQKRRTYNATPETLKELKKLQGKIKAETGIEPSLTELLDEVIKTPAWEEVESQILKKDLKKGIKFDGDLK